MAVVALADLAGLGDSAGPPVTWSVRAQLFRQQTSVDPYSDSLGLPSVVPQAESLEPWLYSAGVLALVVFMVSRKVKR